MIKFGFIGAGAIGSLFGGYLANIKEERTDVSLFCSHNHARAIKKHGLKIYTGDKVITLKNLHIFDRTEENLSLEDLNFNYLFLTTKTYDTQQAIIQYREIIERCKYFVILQNGLGNEDLVNSFIIKKKIFRIITSHGANLSQPGQVIHTGKGFTYIGLPYSRFAENDLYQDVQSGLECLNTLLNFAGFNSQIERDILTKVWQKAIVNIGINAIGALTRLNNGQIIESEGLRSLMEKAVIEACDIGEKMNLSLSKDECITLTKSVANQTYNNKNSMLQDILRGKKTEIDYLNGKITDFARVLGIRVEVNDFLTKLIRGLERGL
ncbi:MAG: ketopantoate reductase family protein [Candidatus Thorarchaeota archaeon]